MAARITDVPLSGRDNYGPFTRQPGPGVARARCSRPIARFWKWKTSFSRPTRVLYQPGRGRRASNLCRAGNLVKLDSQAGRIREIARDSRRYETNWLAPGSRPPSNLQLGRVIARAAPPGTLISYRVVGRLVDGCIALCVIVDWSIKCDVGVNFSAAPSPRRRSIESLWLSIRKRVISVRIVTPPISICKRYESSAQEIE